MHARGLARPREAGEQQAVREPRTALRRFQTRARQLARPSWPSIVTIFGVGVRRDVILATIIQCVGHRQMPETRPSTLVFVGSSLVPNALAEVRVMVARAESDLPFAKAGLVKSCWRRVGRRETRATSQITINDFGLPPLVGDGQINSDQQAREGISSESSNSSSCCGMIAAAGAALPLMDQHRLLALHIRMP